MTVIKAPNGLPYPDANGKVADTWARIRDLALATAPAAFMVRNQSFNENTADQTWRPLAVSDTYRDDPFDNFTASPTGLGIVPGFTGWVEGWGQYSMDYDAVGKRRIIGMGMRQFASPQISSHSYGPFESSTDLTVAGIFPVNQGQPVTVWAWQNSGAILQVNFRQIGLRRLS